MIATDTTVYAIWADDHHFGGAVSYSWSDDYSTCTASHSCASCSEVETETASASYVVDRAASCTASEAGHYEATFENPAFAKAVSMPIASGSTISHIGGTATCDHRATCSACGAEYGDMLPHVYGEVSYSWSDDNSECTASRSCTGCSAYETETASASYAKDSDADCTHKEKGHYVVTFTNKEFGTTTSEQVEIGSPKGHDFTGDWLYDENVHWKKCKNCSVTTQSEAHIIVDHKCTVCDYEDDKFVITFNANGGYGYMQSVEATDTYTLPSCRYQGKSLCAVFDGWATESSATSGLKAGSVIAVDDNMTLYAIWKYVHKPSTGYRYNGTNHWHVCTRCGEKLDVEAHSFTVLCHDSQYHWYKCADCDATARKESHSYKVVSYEWSGNICTMTRKCEGCGYVDTVKATGRYVKDTDAECLMPETGHYEAYFRGYGIQKTAAGSVTRGDQLGHKWGEPEYGWNGQLCTATRSCVRCGASTFYMVRGVKVIDAEPTCEDCGHYHYEAHFTRDGYEDQISETYDFGEALGHEWSEPEYNWTVDGCVASRSCARCGEVETESGKLSRVDDEPTCTTCRVIHWTAEFNNTAFKMQTLDSEVGEPLGHDWSNHDGECAECHEKCDHDGKTTGTCDICGKYLGSSGGGGTSGGSVKTQPAGTVNGIWTYIVTTDKWTFTSSAGRVYHSEWAYIYNPYATGAQPIASWFYFDANGIMLTGYQWIPSTSGGYRLFYLHQTSDGMRGRMYENEWTPDGNYADANGWVYINGVVQAR